MFFEVILAVTVVSFALVMGAVRFTGLWLGAWEEHRRNRARRKIWKTQQEIQRNRMRIKNMPGRIAQAQSLSDDLKAERNQAERLRLKAQQEIDNSCVQAHLRKNDPWWKVW